MRRRSAPAFVRVDRKDPIAARVAQRMVARGRKVILPLEREDASAFSRSDLGSLVPGSCVQHDDFVDEGAD